MGLFRYKALKSGTGAGAGRQPLRLEQKPMAAAIPELGQLLANGANAINAPTSCASSSPPNVLPSVAIVLRHYGLHRLSEVRHACGISRDGSNAAQLVLAARQYGLVPRGSSKASRPCVTSKRRRCCSGSSIISWFWRHSMTLVPGSTIPPSAAATSVQMIWIRPTPASFWP